MTEPQPATPAPSRSPTRNSRIFETLVVIALMVLGMASQIRWNHLYHDAPQADFAMHVADASAFAAVLDTPGHWAEKGVIVWAWPDLYGDGVYATSYLLRPFTGSSVTGLLDSLALYMALAVLGAYLLGRAAGGPAVGATAAVLVLSDPRYINASRHYWLDMPMTAMMLVTLAALVYSEGFRRRVDGVAAGVLLGLSLLVKYTAVWYLALPFLAVFAWGVWTERPKSRALLQFVAAACLSLLAVLFLSNVSLGHRLFTLEDIAPPLSFQLVFGCAAVALLWATFAWYRLDGVLCTASLAGAAAMGIASPWAVINRYIIGERWRAIREEADIYASRVRENVQMMAHDLPWWVIVGAALGVLVVLASPRKRPIMGVVLLAVVAGTANTLMVLGGADRYLVPSTVLLAVLATAVIPRTAWIAWPVFALSLFLPASLLFGEPVGINPDRDAFLNHTFAATVANLRSPEIDREALAKEITAATTDARSIAIVTSQENDHVRDDIFGLYYMLAAAENWSGRPRSVQVLIGTFPQTRLMDLMPMQDVRARSLQQWRGETPTPSARENLAPDVVVVENGLLDPEGKAREAFGRVYHRLPIDVNDVIVLRAATSPR